LIVVLKSRAQIDFVDSKNLLTKKTCAPETPIRARFSKIAHHSKREYVLLVAKKKLKIIETFGENWRQ